ncbi:TRAP transporter small permease [Sphaerotilus sp.]|uniref:TRAP transporter small permease n=1 Tax=Sphaerotilus sp. TaxID=2093942 RepID=UPI0034E2046D
MNWLYGLSAWLSRAVLVLAGICLALLGVIVLYGVVLRYVFNNAPPYVEQIALLLVICVAMFGAAAGVHAAGHIGLDSVVKLLPPAGQRFCALLVEVLNLVFAAVLTWGSWLMAHSTAHDVIPTLGISEASRYVPVITAGILIAIFSLTRLLGLLSQPQQQA